MAKPRLVIETDRYEFYICWYFPDEGDHGGELGDRKYTALHLANAKPDDREHIVATIAASKTKGVRRDGDRRYTWESRSDAQAALRAVKAALAADASQIPWPEWAVTAKAAGWKAPKWWKP